MNTELKRSVYYSTVLGFFGGLAGILVGFILTMVGTPRFENLMVPKDFVAHVKIFSKLKGLAETNMGTATGMIFGIIFYLAFFWFLKNLSNTGETTPYRTATRKKKIVLFISSIFLAVMLWAIQKLQHIPNFLFIKDEINWILLIIGVAAPGILWIFAGAKWLNKNESESISLSYKWCFLLGVAGALIGYGIFSLSGNMGVPFFFFAKDVLFYPDEFFLSIKAIIFLIVSVGFLEFFTAGIIASVLYAFAPIEISFKVRLSRILPGLYLFIFVIIVWQGFKLYLNKFDYDKKSFVGAVGISENQKKSKTVLLLTKYKNGKTISKLKNVTMEVTPLFSSQTDYLYSPNIPVVEKNLEKIEEYIKNHKRSFYLRTAHYILVTGYLMRWDSEKGFAARHRDARDSGSLISTILELSSLSRLPVIEEYKKYLDDWADEEKYYHGPRILLRLSQAYRHFGNSSRMEYFKKKVLEHPVADDKDKEEAKNLQFPTDGILTDGVIKGRILMCGNLPQPEKVGLFWADLEHPREPSLDGFSVGISLVSGQSIDKDGKFIFTDIGEGTYQLAFMFVSEELPADAKIKAVNNPGFISLSKKTPVKNLGVITISK